MNLDWLRYLAAVLGAIAFTVQMVRYAQHADRMDASERHEKLAVAGLLAVACYGSLEAAFQGAPLGVRVVLLILTLAGFLYAVAWPPSRLFRR